VVDCSTDEVRVLREGAIDRQTVVRILGLSDIPVLRSVRQ
jgi:tRNA A37 threonylcarbamoyladenosine synthetase subunit TsaC/SUA5/YrdC